jgi:hypothetical protein
VLDDREHGFHVDPLDLRYLADDGSALLALDTKLTAPDRSSLRLAIGSDVDLLFHQGRYGGWILGNPLAYLVAEAGDKVPGHDEPKLHELLRDYLALVVEPNIARMSDEDPEVRKALQALHRRVRDVSGVQAQVLLGTVERVLDVFYPA